MSKILSTAETISALAEVQEILGEFHARRKELSKATARWAETNRAQFDRALADQQEEEARRRSELSASSVARRTHLDERLKSRRDLLGRAHANAKREGLSRITREEDKRKYLVQKGVLDTERTETNLLADVENERKSLERQLSEQHEELVALGSKIRSLLSQFPLLLSLLKRPQSLTGEESAMDHRRLLSSAERLNAHVREDLAALRNSFPAVVFRLLPVYLVVLLLLGAAVAHFVLRHAAIGMGGLEKGELAAALVYGAGNVLTTLFIRKRIAALAKDLNKATAFHTHARTALETWSSSEIRRIRAEAQSRAAELNRDWLLGVSDAAQSREQLVARLEGKFSRAAARLVRISEAAERRFEELNKQHSDQLEHYAQGRRQALVEENRTATEAQTARETDAFNSLRAATQARLSPVLGRLIESAHETELTFPDWKTVSSKWTANHDFHEVIPFGAALLDVAESDAKEFSFPNFDQSGPLRIRGPISLDFKTQGCLVIEADQVSRGAAMAALNNALFRVVTDAPPGRLSLTIFDPIGLGQNFPAFPRLSDFDCKLLNGQIWAQSEQFEARLVELNLHIERVIQVCLRDEYADVIDYNRQPGNIAERFHIVVLADFGTNISDSCLRLLAKIFSAGPRCGVFTFLHYTGPPTDVISSILEPLQKQAVSLQIRGAIVRFEDQPGTSTIQLEQPPSPGQSQRLLEAVAQAHVNATEVRVPFSEVAPSAAEVWSLNTAEELRVAIGRAGPNKLQYLALGKGTRQHALVAGKTGSGKSTLFHVIITNLALWCSPQEVEFYLIDFKKGIEFKSYATNGLPHARVIAIESDREFGLSVLQRLDQELRRRGENFRKAGVQDLPGYRSSTGQPMPRTLLLIDEFQEFFTEDDRIAQSASLLLDRIVRQGRAFGIHVILGSQTLGGAYTLARSTLGQMVVRIALQSNEADASFIMDEGNSAARLLSRPGEGIYNDRGGAVDANSAFQVVWVSDAQRDELLSTVAERQRKSGYPMPDTVVFEGNAPANPRENRELVRLLKSGEDALNSAEPRTWLGAPNSIAGPTEVVFANRSGANLLIVGQAEEAALSIFATALMALTRQFKSGAARFIVIDGSHAGWPSIEVLKDIIKGLPQNAQVISASLEEGMGMVQQALESPRPERLFVLLHNVQNLRRLRLEDDFSLASLGEQTAKPADIFEKALSEGPRLGIHTIASIDTVTNTTRFIGRRNLAEFEMRVLFQMNANDSAALCDDPRASGLGMHKALLYRAETGSIEIFRPYALPELASLLTSSQVNAS